MIVRRRRGAGHGRVRTRKKNEKDNGMGEIRFFGVKEGTLLLTVEVECTCSVASTHTSAYVNVEQTWFDVDMAKV